MVRVAKFTEYNRIFQLIYKQYLKSGLISENKSRKHFLHWYFIPFSTIFVNDELDSTLTSVIDLFSIPAYSIFPEEISEQRKIGRLTEACCLAGQGKNIMKLIRALARHARENKVDQVIITTHPKRVQFYEKIIGFHKFTEEKIHPIYNQPAVGLVLNFEEVDRNNPPCYQYIFGNENV